MKRLLARWCSSLVSEQQESSQSSTPSEPSVRVEIATRAASVTLDGPGATPAAAYALWAEVWNRMSLREAEAGGMGFTLERNEGRTNNQFPQDRPEIDV